MHHYTVNNSLPIDTTKKKNFNRETNRFTKGQCKNADTPQIIYHYCRDNRST